MQYNHIFTLKKAANTPLTATILKAAIFLFVIFYILHSINNKENFNSHFKDTVLQIHLQFPGWIYIPLVLFPVNWALEAWKWKLLTRRIEPISFLRSFRGVLAGVALGFVTPLGLGDYAGRVLQLNSPERGRSIGAVFVSRIAQFYITLVLGGIALIAFARHTSRSGLFDNFFDVFLAAVLVFNVMFISLFLFHRRVLNFLKSRKLFRRIYPYIEIIGEYGSRELAYVLSLSFLRYAVFTIQFVLLLYFFGVNDNVNYLFAGVIFIFLVKSVVPTLFDLGIRESAAIYFFSEFTQDTDRIVFASLSVWAINILLPAFMGVFLIFKLKFFTRP